ncbi:MAG: GNAT family N-acetyltransferase, partial [Alphaproteobacteria bacterium]|nr:GNAT family N-acetyltransferase [Alphaproteobacteria bacterium]
MDDLIQAAHKTQEYFLWALSKEIFDDRGVTAFAPGINEPNLNFAMQTGDFGNDIEKILSLVEEFYEARHIPWSWVINPSRDQENLKTVLKKRGYTLISNYPIFVGFLEDVFLNDPLKTFTIQEIGEEQLLEWIAPLQEAFQGTKVNAHLYLEAHHLALKKKANFRHFVTYVKGKPVSAATLSLSSYGARLDDLGTTHAYQRKGFGRAMTLYAMKIAKELGYEWVCLEASDQGALLYESMGFKELYRNEIYG